MLPAVLSLHVVGYRAATYCFWGGVLVLPSGLHLEHRLLHSDSWFTQGLLDECRRVHYAPEGAVRDTALGVLLPPSASAFSACAGSHAQSMYAPATHAAVVDYTQLGHAACLRDTMQPMGFVLPCVHMFMRT